MSLTRQQLRHHAAIAQYQAGKRKPPTRKQAKAWLAPIRSALAELRTGEVDSWRGYAITRIKRNDEDFARIDHCINGFCALIARLMPDTDISPFTRLAKKLESGIMLTVSEIDECLALIKRVENGLITFSRERMMDAANTEMVAIELERLGIKEAA